MLFGEAKPIFLRTFCGALANGASPDDAMYAGRQRPSSEHAFVRTADWRRFRVRARSAIKSPAWYAAPNELGYGEAWSVEGKPHS